MSTLRVLRGPGLAVILATLGCGQGDGNNGVQGSSTGNDGVGGFNGIGWEWGRSGESTGNGGASGGFSYAGSGSAPQFGLGGSHPGKGGAAGSAAGESGAGATGGADADASAGAGGDTGEDSGTSGAAGCEQGAGLRSLMSLPETCVVTACANHVYECGDCVDNDGDGLSDMDDPDCLGPCHNSETMFFLKIPGANNAPCKQDCYFDQDSGAGNDDCYWSQQCDWLEVPPLYDPAGAECSYDPSVSTPGTTGSCNELSLVQSKGCLDTCGPLTPNGCDCFGCCEIPGGSGQYVWLGSKSEGSPSCDLAHADDPTRCRPCTPVPACLNTCEECELCIGKTELPASCLCEADGAKPETCGVQECPEGAAPCGLDCQAPCAVGYFCLTGCCQPAPQ